MMVLLFMGDEVCRRRARAINGVLWNYNVNFSNAGICFMGNELSSQSGLYLLLPCWNLSWDLRRGGAGAIYV